MSFLMANQRQVVGAGIMIHGAFQAAGIGKMCADAPQLCSPVVHHVRESLNTASNVFRSLSCHVIGGFYKDHLQTLLRCKYFAQNRAAVRASRIRLGKACLRHGDLLIHTAVFHQQQSGHNFRQAGRISLGVHPLGVQHRACLRFHNDACLCLYIRRLGPLLPAVGVHLKRSGRIHRRHGRPRRCTYR